MSDKLGVIDALLGIVDALMIGGGMASRFSRPRVTRSVRRCSRSPESTTARHCSTAARDPPAARPHGAGPGRQDRRPDAGGEVRQAGVDLPDGWMGLDIGPGTAAAFGDLILDARTVLWNGPMGVFEDPRFAAARVTSRMRWPSRRRSPWSVGATAPPQ